MLQRCTLVRLFSVCLLALLATPIGFGGAARQFWPDDPNAQYVVFAGGILNDQTREWEVPVEAKTFRLHFWARVDGAITLEILGVGGKAQPLTDPNVSPTLGRERQSVVVFDPRPGVWKVRVKGTGSFTVGVTTQSELYVCCLSIIGPGGPVGHPLPPNVPLKARNQAMQASLAGFEIQSVEFHLVDEENQVLRPVKLRQNDYSNPYLLIMLVESPAKPFRLMARGRDQTGYAFQRIFLPLFQPPSEEARVEPTPNQTPNQPQIQAPNQLLSELERSGEPGPYQIVRVSVSELLDEPLVTESGEPIGLRLKYSLRFPRDGYYTPTPQVYPEQIRSGYTGALSLKVHRFEIAPLPEGSQTAPQLRYLSRAFYKAGQVYRFTVDLIPNYIIYNEQKRAFCIASRTFSHTSRERFTNEVTSEMKMRFRMAIQGTEMDGRQPQLTEQTYVPNLWYAGYIKGGAAECQ